MPDDDIGKTIAATVDKQMSEVKQRYEAELKTRFDTLEKDLRDRVKKREEEVEKEVKNRSTTIVLSVVGLAVLAFLVSMIGWTSQVNGAVIGLQKDIIAAQTTVRGATKELDDSAGTLRQQKATVDAELTRANAALQLAEKQLIETRQAYEQRLREFQSTRKTP